MRIILIGQGKTTYFLAREFAEARYHVTVIVDNSADAIDLSRRLKTVVMVGDGTRPRILEEADIRRADAVLALLPNDEDNLVACQVARRRFNVPTIVSLINDPDNEQLFRKLGVRSIISPTKLLISMIREETQFKEIIDFLPVAGGRISITEVVLPMGAPSIGNRLADLHLPTDSLIAAIIRGKDVVIPRGEDTLEIMDRVLLVAKPTDLDQALLILIGKKV